MAACCFTKHYLAVCVRSCGPWTMRCPNLVQGDLDQPNPVHNIYQGFPIWPFSYFNLDANGFFDLRSIAGFLVGFVHLFRDSSQKNKMKMVPTATCRAFYNLGFTTWPVYPSEGYLHPTPWIFMGGMGFLTIRKRPYQSKYSGKHSLLKLEKLTSALSAKLDDVTEGARRRQSLT